ncbi:MAG: hypothetical protein VR66_24315 [Peptococcaceae bacterium BRH_c23]|nr:MAG: hypothetical protein VR66_24315 [Peptococcaceae bacterium BRH_c23]KJS89706.1 MAG: hypothetical protein JL57_05875 [Desulfosporosinus sp. BICA1-9]
MNTYGSAVGDNILIVEDKPENLLILKGYLNTIDCNIIRAKSVKEGLDYLRNYEFALLILDMKMLEIDNLTTSDIPKIYIVSNSLDQGFLYIDKKNCLKSKHNC